MGSLVRFDSRRRFGAQHMSEGEGKVLIFTGVRYERTPDAPEPEATRSPSTGIKRNRKRSQ